MEVELKAKPIVQVDMPTAGHLSISLNEFLARRRLLRFSGAAGRCDADARAVHSAG